MHHGSPDLVERFLLAVDRFGDRQALEFDGAAWSYRALDRASAALARALVQAGAGPGGVVVIDSDRGPGLVLAILACVRARRVFFVIGEHQPAAYVASAIAGLGHVFWLGVRGHSNAQKAADVSGGRLSGCLFIDPTGAAWPLDDVDAPDAVVAQAVSAEGAGAGMYLVATSGTTGPPKLVLTGMGPVLNFLDWYHDTFEMSQRDRFSLLSGLGYDPLIRDIMTPLTLGACLCIPGKEAFGLRGGLAAWVEAREISIIHATPQLAHVLFDADPGKEHGFGKLRLLAIGGSALTRAHAARLKSVLKHAELLNVYGTSETPQVMVYHRVQAPLQAAEADLSGLVPLGKPIRNVQVRVVRADGTPAGVGEAGQVHVVTPHLALGYFGDTPLTQQKFLDGGEPGTRCYLTGDLGYIDADGELHFCGRADRQVKHRGYRLQLEEIERTVLHLADVRSVAVVHRQTADAERMVCFVQPRPGEAMEAAAVKQRLVQELPTFMMPDRFVFLENMPLTSGNKIDYAALAGMASAEPTPERAPAAHPVRHGGAVTREIQAIWARVLGIAVTDIALDDNFFDTGGNSLLSAKLIEQMNLAFATKLRTTDLFVHSSINDLSRHVVASTHAAEPVRQVLNVGKRAHRLAQVQIERGKRA